MAEPELPKKLADVIEGSVNEAFALFDDAVKHAETQEQVEPGKYDAGLIEDAA